jgi:hypothetical protein
MMLKFDENSVLNKYNEYTPCKDVFQAVCDEIGKHYVSIGWKYTRSRPKITFKNKEIKIEIAFWSSGSNTPGSYVNLEILPNISSIELVNQSKKEGKKTKGYILSFIQLLTERYDNKEDGTKKIIKILTDNTERIDEYDSTPEIKYNNNINVYGINENELLKIIDFIDNRIVSWTKTINNKDDISTFLSNLTDYHKKELLASEFGRLLTVKYPETEFE